MDDEIDKMKKCKDKQKYYYNQKVKELPKLKAGDTVRIKPQKLGNKEWQMGRV